MNINDHLRDRGLGVIRGELIKTANVPANLGKSIDLVLRELVTELARREQERQRGLLPRLWAAIQRRFARPIPLTVTRPITADEAHELAWMFYGVSDRIRKGELEWDREHNGGLMVSPHDGEGLRISGDVAFRPTAAVTHDWRCDACGKWNPDRRDENPCGHCGAARADINTYRKHVP